MLASLHGVRKLTENLRDCVGIEIGRRLRDEQQTAAVAKNRLADGLVMEPEISAEIGIEGVFLEVGLRSGEVHILVGNQLDIFRGRLPLFALHRIAYQT